MQTPERLSRLMGRHGRSLGILWCAVFAAMLSSVLWPGGQAMATVEGTPPSLYRSFRVFGTHVATGNTLMSNTPSQPLVNSILLNQSAASLTTIPQDSVVEGAFLFWSGSIQNRPDRNASFGLPDGFEQSVQADTCFTSPALDGFFYCRAEVTDIVRAHPAAPGNHNGLYTVGDVSARAGVLDQNGQCVDANCQARYAGWSIVLVYSNEFETTQRDIILFDGFRQLDETPVSAGIDNFVINGFEVANPPQGSFTFFGLEGDALLGIPPQDQDPNPQLRCFDCDDYIEINGQRLQDPNNPPGNLFNSTTPTGGSLGIDIDTFDISTLVDVGDTSVAIEVGSGDGRPTTQGGGGESIFLGYTVLSLNRLSPNFRTANTRKSVDPEEAGPGETVFFEILVTNDGSLAANNVVVTDVLDGRFEYVADSTRVDGVAVPDVAGQSPLQRGLRLGRLGNQGDNDRRVTFRARVAAGVVSGSRLPNTARITATELPDPVQTNSVIVTVVAPTLGTPLKTARDINGGDLEPGDVVGYTIFIPNNSGRTASGVRFVDDMPPFVQLQTVSPTPFNDRSNPGGGINGNGRVEVEEIIIPAALDGIFINYEVRIDSAQELIDQGIRPEDIDGLAIANQGRVQADFLLADLLTDDPNTAPGPDPTVVRLVSAVNLRNPRTFKRGADTNGGQLLPGDTIRYTVSLSNAGNSDAVVNFSDSLPPFVENFVLETPLPTAVFAPAPAGNNATGLLTVRDIDVAGGATVTFTFTVQVGADTPSNTRIQNIADVVVPAFPTENQELASEALTVVSGVSFEQSLKEVVNAPPGGFQPGDQVDYVLTVINSGNRPGTGVIVQDDVALNLTNVVVQDGGTFDAVQRRVTWNVGAMAPGAAQQLRFSATIVEPLANGTRIRNQGVVFSDNTDGGTVTDDPSTGTADDATVIVIQSAPALEASTKVVQDINGGSFEPGDAVRYVITITNNGRDLAREVIVSDDIDARLNVDNVDNGGVLAGGRIAWTFINTPELQEVAPGETVELSFTATLAAPLDNGTLVPNQAFINSLELANPVPTDDPATPDVGDPTVIEISAPADLGTSLKEVVDENGGAVQPGDILTYTITVVNSGSGSARETVVTDTVPSELAGVTPADGGTFDAGSRQIRWALAGPVPAGDQTTVSFQARVADGTANGTIIANQASINSIDLDAAVVTDDPRNGVGDDNATEVTVEARPDFVNSTKFARNESNPGEGFRPADVVLYTITVRNSGSTAANNVRVEDALPAQLEDIEVLDGGVLVGNTVTWTLPTLGARDEVEVRVRGTILNPLDDGTEVSNQAFITSAEILEPVPTDNPNTEEEDDPVIFVVSSRPVFLGSRKLFVDANGDSARPGDEITYTIELINSGSSSARNVVVTDVIDANLTNVDVLDGGVFDAGTRTVTWSAPQSPVLANVPPDPNNAVELRVRATVADALDNGTIISNQASIISDELDEAELTDDPRTGDFPDPTSFPVVSASDLNDASKTVQPADDGQFNPGDTVRYTVSFTNNGDAPANNVVVTDVIDENLVFTTASDGGTFDGLTVRWDSGTTPSLARVEPGASVLLRLEAVVVSPVANGTVVFNQARVSADSFVNAVVTDDPETPELDDPTLIVIASAPELGETTKTVRDLDGDDIFEPGDVVEYVITVTNTGDDAARQVAITDAVDTTSLTNVSPFEGGRLQGNTITWDQNGNPALAEVGPGQAGRAVVRFRATIAADALNGAVVSNQAFVQADGLAPVPSDDPITPRVDDAVDFVITAEARFDGMTKEVQDLNGGAIEAGDRLRYSIVVTNEGTQVGRNVVVTDEVDPALIDAVAQGGGQVLGQLIRWNLGDLLPGQSVEVSFEASVRGNIADGTRIPNQAVLTAEGIPGVPSDDPSTGLGDDDPTVVIVNARPDLSEFTKTATDVNGGFLRPGDVVSFDLTVRNLGPGTAREIVVRDPLDTSILTDVVPGQGGRLQAGVVTWTALEVPQLAELPAGESVTLNIAATVRGEVPNGTAVLNQANLSSVLVEQEFSDDPGTDRDNDPTRVEVRFPEFGPLVKDFEDLDGGLIEAGDTVRYTILVQGRGQEALTNVRLVDPVSELLTDIQPFAGGVFNAGAGEIVWDAASNRALGRVDPGEQVEVGFTAQIREDVLPGQTISNQAVASSAQDINLTEPSDDPSNGLGDRDATIFVVEAEPLADLSQTEKRVEDNNGGVVEPGDVLTYTIVVRNTGRGPTGALTLIDPVPPLTSYVAGSTTLDGDSVGNGAQSPLVGGLELPELRPGQSSTVVFQVEVNEEAPNGAIVANQALVNADAGVQALSDDPTTSNQDDATTVVVGVGPNITGAIKTAQLVDSNNNGQLDINEVLEYTIRIPNRGTTEATGVIFRDVLDDGLRYQPGFFSVNGGGLTDADDGDAGSVVDGTVTVALGTIVPGEAPVIRFRARVVRGPEAINQGTITGREFAAELTDADGNEANGNQPTRTAVGAGAATIEVSKSVSDPNGGVVEPGDELTYTITVTNSGSATAEQAVIVDPLPGEVTLVGVTAAPAGAAVNVGGRIEVAGFDIPAGESRSVVLQVRLDGDLPEGAVVCNEATATARGVSDVNTLEPACASIGAVVGNGRLEGRVFEDVGQRDGTFGEGDNVFEDFLVRIYRKSSPDEIVAEATTDEEGVYVLPILGRGDYIVKAFSQPFGSDPVEFARQELEVGSGSFVRQDVLVDPSGRVYNSVTGERINGAEVLIFYADDDPDPNRAGRLVPPEDLPENQQGQLTRDGLYRFDVLPGHIYRLEVVAPNQSLIFPSGRFEPQPRAWDPDQDPNEVIESEFPDLSIEQVYFLTFDIRGVDDFVVNNHIPVDPISSLIRLDKRANKRTATLGEIISYTVTVTNGSTRDLVFDENTGLGGVFVLDSVPKGFDYVEGSARVRRKVSGRTVGSDIAEPQGELTLNFGIRPPDGSNNGRPQPMSIGAGETIELQYQLVVGSDVAPGKEHINRAVLVSSDGNTPLSNNDEARVRVVFDPIFDQGLVLGKVFCDADGDGWQDDGEQGVYRARIYMDNGWYAVTDNTGKFHFRAVDPGNHMLKLDADTLPPGGEPTGSVKRVFYVTRGLPVKVSFGTTCPENMISDVNVNASKELVEEQEKRIRENFVTVSGSLNDVTAALDGAPLPMPTATMSVGVKGKDDARPIVNGVGPKFDAPLVFTPAIDGSLDAEQWAVQIARTDNPEIVHVLSGKGDVPTEITFDGKGPGGQAVLGGPQSYTARLVIHGASGVIVHSPSVVFGVSGRDKALVAEEIFRGDLFDKRRNNLTDDLKGKLRSVKGQLRAGRRYVWSVEVHTDDQQDKPEKLVALTQKRAAAIEKFLAEELKIKAKDIEAKGYGGRLALVPNINDRNIFLNNRVEVRVTDPNPPIIAPKLPKAEQPISGVFVNDKELRIEDDGTFSKQVLKPADGLLVLVIRNRDGGVTVRRININAGYIGLMTPRMKMPKVPVSGDLSAGSFNIGKTTVAPDLLKVKATVDDKERFLEQGSIKPPVRFALEAPSAVQVDGYKLEVTDPSGVIIHTTRGRSTLPPGVRWGGAVDQDRTFLIPGWYQATLTVYTADGQVGRSEVVLFELKEPKPKDNRRNRRNRNAPKEEAAPAGPPKVAFQPEVYINGAPVNVDSSGGFRSNAEAYTGQMVIVEVVTAKGARAVMHLTVPKGYPKPVELDPGNASPVLGVAPPTGAPSVPLGAEGGDNDQQDGAPKDDAPAPVNVEGGDGGEKPAGGPAGDAKPGDAESGDAKPGDAKPKDGDKPAPAPAPAKPGVDEDGDDVDEDGDDVDTGQNFGPGGPAQTAPVGLAQHRPMTFDRLPTVRLAQADEVVSDAGEAVAGSEADAEASQPTEPSGLGAFGGDKLDDALRGLEESNVDKEAMNSPAANLQVNLPAQGTVLRSRELVVTGSTDPTNKITINGAPVEVVDGEFTHYVKLPLGPSEVVITTEDLQGNRGELRWPVEVSDTALFMMAFADAGVALEGAELEGMNEDNSMRTDGGTLLYGQARFYLKGHMSGRQFLDNFFEEYRFTAFFDSSRLPAFEAFLTETINPDAYYPIYGDSAEEVREANARGKLYIMIEADESSLVVGNTRAGLQGVQFFRYDRPMYGARVDFKKVIAEDYKTEVKAFASADDTSVRHTYNYMQGTGGSLYWLRNGNVVEGSERITLVVKDEASGVELLRVPQTRHADYTVDYRSGRILFKTPIPSAMRSGYMASRVNTTQLVLDGHPIFVEVSYDYEGDDARNDGAYGGHVRQTFYDVVSLGGGVVKETRPSDGADYTLWGVEAGLKKSERTRLMFEYAASESQDTLSLMSTDGGLTYDRFSRRDGADKDGAAWLVSGQLEFGDFWYDGDAPEEYFWMRAYYQQVESGFFSNGTILEQGQEKFGGEAIWRLNASNNLRIRHDGVLTMTDNFEDPNPESLKEVERQVTTLQHRLVEKDWRLTTEYNHTFFDDATKVDGIHTDILGTRLDYDLNERFGFFVGQQWVIRGDDRIYDETADQFQTDLGMSIKIVDGTRLELSESVRWNGENATQIGLTSALSDNSSVYIRERIATREGGAGSQSTTVIGGENRFDNGSGRLYSEYQIDSGIQGERSRAVVGIGKGFTIGDGWTLDLAYERSQIFADEFNGEQSRDVLSAGYGFLGKSLKFSQKFEVRYDDADAQVPQQNPCLGDGIFSNPDFCRDNLPGGQDKLQFLTANALTLTFWEDHNLLARFNFSTTENITLDREEARFMAASFGYALRPVDSDWVNLLVKYTYLQNLRPIDLLEGREERENAHVFSVVPVFETPIRLQFVEKLAWKRQFVRFDNLPEAESDTFLAISRVNYHLTDIFDLGVEYRFLHNTLADDLKHGALVEFSYIIYDYARLGVGYNFTSFSDDELSDLDRDVGGFFFRVQGTY